MDDFNVNNIENEIDKFYDILNSITGSDKFTNASKSILALEMNTFNMRTNERAFGNSIVFDGPIIDIKTVEEYYSVSVIFPENKKEQFDEFLNFYNDYFEKNKIIGSDIITNCILTVNPIDQIGEVNVNFCNPLYFIMCSEKPYKKANVVKLLFTEENIQPFVQDLNS